MRSIQQEIDKKTYGPNIPEPAQWKDFYREDDHIQEVVKRYISDEWRNQAERELTFFGKTVAQSVDSRAAFTDGEGKPKLRRFDRLGQDISKVETNLGYQQTIKETYESGIVGYLYHGIDDVPRQVPYMFSFLQGYLLSQSEPGVYCPVTLTLSAAHLVSRFGSDELKERYLTGLTALSADHLYEGATWLTERQGGSDVGANETVAELVAEREGVYKLTGEKFFASNAGAMVATVLARVDLEKRGTRGLGLFLVPWTKPDGERNTISIRRLKEKLGVNAVPSAEVLLDGAEGYLIGDVDKGFKYMAEALNISRICNAIAAVGIMKRAVKEAQHYTANRKAFGQAIQQYPMVKQTLARMAMETEVNIDALFEVIDWFDQTLNGQGDGEKAILSRMMISLLKYRTGEVVKGVTHDAIELHGGNGFIEEYVTPRLLRDAQVLSVWEGTANVLGLDLLRMMKKEQAHEVFVGFMRRELHTLTHPNATETVVLLKRKTDEIEQFAQGILQADEPQQTYYVKQLADRMVDTFQLLVSLQVAQQEGATGQQRKFVVADLFREVHFPAITEVPNLNKMPIEVEFFESILRKK